MIEKLQDRFNESIQLQIVAATELPTGIYNAAFRLVSCFLQGNKVLVCGYGRSYANAQLLVNNLLHRYDLKRPSLAAHLLSLDGMLMSSLDQEQELAQLYRKQLQVLAKEGDILVLFSPDGSEEIILNAIQCANSENLTIIAFTGSGNAQTQGLLDETDIEITFPSSNEMRVVEGHQFCVNLLSETIDHLLFNPTSQH